MINNHDTDLPDAMETSNSCKSAISGPNMSNAAWPAGDDGDYKRKCSYKLSWPYKWAIQHELN